MAKKTIAELEREFQKVSDETQKAYDVLHPTFGSDARQIAYEYEKAVKENDSKTIKKLKPLYDKAQAAYTDAQNRKNALRKELEAAKQKEETSTKSRISKESAANVYDKSFKELLVAEAKINSYNGEENYIQAYRKAENAYNDAIKVGVTPKKELPQPKITIPPVQQQGQEGGKEGQTVKEPTPTEFVATITNPANKQQLIDVQKDLAKNFGYTGPTDGSPSALFMPALQKAYTQRASLPEAWRGTDFRTFLANPGTAVSGATGAGGAGGQYDPYGALQVWDKVRTKAELTALYDNLGIDRDPTDKEINSIFAQLDKKQKEQKATVTKYKMINGVRTAVTTPGFNQAQFITDLVKGTKEYQDVVARKETQEGQKILSATKQLEDTAIANDITLSKDQIDAYAARVKAGEDVNLIKGEIRRLASIGQPDSIKKLIEQGNDLTTIYDPYRKMMGSILEINPNTIPLNDPTLRMAIGPDKEMSLYDYQRALRKDPRWEYTNQARSETANAITTVLKDFGFMG